MKCFKRNVWAVGGGGTCPVAALQENGDALSRESDRFGERQRRGELVKKKWEVVAWGGGEGENYTS